VTLARPRSVRKLDRLVSHEIRRCERHGPPWRTVRKLDHRVFTAVSVIQAQSPPKSSWRAIGDRPEPLLGTSGTMIWPLWLAPDARYLRPGERERDRDTQRQEHGDERASASSASEHCHRAQLERGQHRPLDASTGRARAQRTLTAQRWPAGCPVPTRPRPRKRQLHSMLDLRDAAAVTGRPSRAACAGGSAKTPALNRCV
jgi:hypothetical protein